MEFGDLRLLSRDGCHLCQEAEALLRRLSLRFQVVDVDADEQLRALYGDAVPVLLDADGRELARAPLTEARLRTLTTSRHG